MSSTATLTLSLTAAVASAAVAGYIIGRKNLIRHYFNLDNGHQTPDIATSPRSTSTASPIKQRQAPLPSDTDSQILIVIRSDLNLSAAHVIRDASRALLGLYKKLYLVNRHSMEAMRQWEGGGMNIKVAFADSEKDLELVRQAAKAYGMTKHLHSGGGDGDGVVKRRTALAVGPGSVDQISEISQTLSSIIFGLT
jgi:peptidyl-tRNA hydrolase